MLGELHHPNVVGFRGVYYSVQDAVFNLVMEFCDGGTLASVLRHEANSPPPRLHTHSQTY